MSSHRHAVTWTARYPIFHFVPFAVGDVASLLLRPILPNVAATSQNFAVPVSAKHWSRRQIDRWEVHTDRAHQQSWRRFVAAAHQNHSIDWLGSNELFRLHREKVPIHHRTRFHVGFGD